jgi:outer membrane protein
MGNASMVRGGRFALGLFCFLAPVSPPIPAFAADYEKPGPATQTWIVTVGAWTYLQPEFEGSDELGFGVKPIIDIRRPGAREWLSLPSDHGGITLFSTNNFRIGPSFNFIQRRKEDDSDALRGLGDVDWALEVGAYAEYWLTDFVRTRAEARRGFNGHEGFVADFSADFVWRPLPPWTLTLGPRLSIADDEYMRTYFSVTPAQAVTSGLRAFDAQGGLKSAGALASVTYQWTPQFATMAYLEYARLLGDAADSPIVSERGSRDQFTVGVGAKYSFSVDTSGWTLFSGR